MKHAFLIAAITLAPFGAAMAKAPDACSKISALAGEAMEQRQNGVLLEKAVTSVGDGSKFSEDMVMRAYTIRVYQDDDEKQVAIDEFRNGAYRECYDAHN